MRAQEQASASRELEEEAQGAVRRGALAEEAASAAERSAQRLLEDNEALMADNQALLDARRKSDEHLMRLRVRSCQISNNNTWHLHMDTELYTRASCTYEYILRVSYIYIVCQ
jgi:hypothetical protein